MHSALRGFDTSRFLESMSASLMFGNGNVEIDTGIRSDNAVVVDHVRPINSVTKERRSNVFLESNREEPGGGP